MRLARPPGRPRAGQVVADAARSVRAQPLTTATTALVVALVCVVVLLTTGRAAASERAVVASIDAVGTRLVTVSDGQGQAGLDASSVAEIARLDGVEWVFGLGPASDGTNAALPGRTGVAALRPLVGDLPDDVRLADGRAPAAPGEAVVGRGAAAALHLGDVAGGVTDGRATVGVVGRFEAVGSLASLDDLVLYRPAPDATDARTLRQVHVLVSDASLVPEVTEHVRAVLRVRDPSRVEVESSEGALRLREAVAGTLGATSRQLMLGVLGGGLVLVTVTVLGAVQGRRRDLGRRRALGASRSAIVALVLLQTLGAGCLGALLGTVAGLAAASAWTGATPPWTFAAGVGTTAVLMGLVGAVPPALLAAFRDPVRILRVP
ncbi:ABC transporter permease [Cellulomonas fimi]|nr:ABC transporter permease [Cellulomonas fimi]